MGISGLCSQGTRSCGIAARSHDDFSCTGKRNVFVAVPIGTYTGWNQFNKNFFEDGFCTLSGSFIPFAPTKQERLAIADARPSIEERYPTKETYVAAFRKAANDLVAQRFLLADDAARLISEAERNGIRSAP